MTIKFRSAVSVIARGLAERYTPPEVLLPSEWGKRHIVVPDGPMVGTEWDPSLTPYIVEPLNHYALDSGVNEFAVMKSAQTGFTMMLLIAMGFVIDNDPCRMMMVLPNDAALSEFNREKLSPVISRSKRLNKKVRPHTNHSATGSTTYVKAFNGGSLTLTIATSSSDLSSKTVKMVFLDEIDRYPDDVHGQGSPLGLVQGRYLSFRRTGDWKRGDVSTPTMKGVSAIEDRYESGDQRRWHVTCPGCGEEFYFKFDRNTFVFNDKPPYEAHYVTECCGHVIEFHERDELVREGRWVPMKPRPGAYPSYHLDVLISPFVPWDDVASEFLASRGKPLKEMAFTNLWLGLPHEVGMDDLTADDVVKIAEPYERGVIPIRAAKTAITIDLNGDWFEWALWAYGPSAVTNNKARPGVDQWLVDHGKINGKPESLEAWAEVKELLDREWPFAGGTSRQVDLVGIDTGFGTNYVYKFVRGRAKVRALDGRPNKQADPKSVNRSTTSLPLGTPSRVVARDQFDRPLFKVWLYPVGTFDLKRWVIDSLSSSVQGIASQDVLHLSREIVGDAAFADQLLAEVLVPVELRDGRDRMEWRKRRGVRNELLDLTVYGRALAVGTSPNGLGLDRLSWDSWVSLIATAHGISEAEAAKYNEVIEAQPLPGAPRGRASKEPGRDPEPNPPSPAPTNPKPKKLGKADVAALLAKMATRGRN